MRMKILSILVLVLTLACIAEHADTETTGESAATLTLFSPPIPAVSFDGGFEIHGVDANRQFWFAAVPSAVGAQHVGVIVADRWTGERVGMLPPPVSGFGAVMAVRVDGGDRLAVLDAVVDPAHAGFAPAVLYEYAIATHRPFSATLLSTHTLPLIPISEIPSAFSPEPRTALSGIFYPLAFTIADTSAGRIAIITDAVGGAIWIQTLGGSSVATLALMDPRLRPAPHAPILGRGRATASSTRDYTFSIPGVFPGVFGIAAHHSGQVVFSVPAQGGIWKLSIDQLLSSSSFATKGAAIRPLITVGTTPDLVAAIDADRFDADRFVYFQRTAADASTSFQNVLYRASIDGGAAEPIAKSNLVYDWSVSISVVPALLPHTIVIASAMGQEQNNADVNASLGGTSTFVAPTLIGAVLGIR